MILKATSPALRSAAATLKVRVVPPVPTLA
jgi:hypothetical protein